MSKYTVEICQPNEIEIAISILEKELYANGQGEKHFEWFYQYNGNILIFLKDTETKQVVGCAGCGFSPFIIDDKSYTGAIFVDLFVEKGYRTPSNVLFLFSELVKFGLTRADFCYGIPNDKATPLFRASKLFTCIAPFQRYISILNAKELIGVQLKDDIIGRFITLCLSGFLWAKHRTYRLLSSPVHVSCKLTPVTDEVSSIQARGLVKSQRSQKYNNWRYIMSPHETYKFFTSTSNGQTASIIYYILKNRAYIVDLVCKVNDLKILIKTLNEFNVYCYDKQISMVVLDLVTNVKFGNLLKKAFYVRSADHKKRLWMVSSDETLINRLQDTNGYLWFTGNEDVN